MINRKFFFDYVKQRLHFGRLKQSQVNGYNQILDYWENENLKDVRWLAYVLATTYHETDKTIKPLREYGKGRGRKYGIPDSENGQTYYGRGYVQLTWRKNYQKYSDILEIDLVDNPDLALDQEIATKILFHGMINGVFTGKALKDYFNENKSDWYNARRIVNGTDKMYTIGDYGKEFFAAISFNYIL
ncbi:glycoside hydrolase family 19 protein [uncultured Tenacibaculum sp.]|uniref:glycoside hydrolase family 19 protein n=1 Tax=uncultured Tenacibaculum sp. TaxID=174713 RepID=UPI00261EB90F|nr:glycoside hydrolase family 19 protein [uncultured Tenacibaculum sp.]